MWIGEACVPYPGRSGRSELSRCSAVNPAGLEQLMCGTCGVWVESPSSLRSGPCCFSQSNVSEWAGLAGAGSLIGSSDTAGGPMAFLLPCSRAAIGAWGLHTQIRWKWHKHVDTRIGFISSWAKSQPRFSFGHSTGILPHYIIGMMMVDFWHSG